MPSFFDDPYKMQWLNQIGMGMLQAAQPQPYGSNRMTYVSNALNSANQNMRQSQLFDMQKRDYEERRAEKASREQATERLGSGFMSDAWTAQQGLGAAGLDPATGIDWQSQRQPSLMDDGQKMSLMAQANPDMFAEAMIKRALPAPGKAKVTDAMANAGQYATPGTPEYLKKLTELLAAETDGLTTPQQTKNIEIDQARSSLAAQGMTQEEIIRIAKSQKDTGRNNPDYNPFINKMVGLATQRKYGPDPGFSQAYQQYLMPAPPEPATAAAPSSPRPRPRPTATAPVPGFFDRLFGGNPQPGQPAQSVAPTFSGPTTTRGVGNAMRGAIPAATQQGPAARQVKPLPINRNIAKMSLVEIDGLLNGPDGAKLTEQELADLDARLTALGR